ncbi:MAG: hypothetical protein M1611_00955 [Candidatus Marsarchaeota archaeon]|nr:hypothetical protein [Candidatus Marsarchaeota archaeon]
MKKYALALLFAFFVLASPSLDMASPPATIGSTYCTPIFTPSKAVVSTSFVLSPGSVPIHGTFGGVISIALLIVLMVFTVIALVYGVGVAFRIDKLIRFGRAELLESFANVVIIVVIAFGVGTILGAASFLANLGSLNVVAPSSGFSTGVQGFYTNTCINIFNNVIITSLFDMVGGLANAVVYEILDDFQLTFVPGGYISYVVPGFEVQPFQGIGPIVSLTFVETSTFTAFIMTGLGIIFMLFVIYYLFPVFLYLGIVLRSFPWTRPAGGALIAIFVSFYIFFPALLYPFTTFGSSVSNIYCNGSSSHGGTTSTTGSPVPDICSSNNITHYIATGGIDALLALLGNINAAFNSNVEIYASMVAAFAIEFIGFAIAFLISYDLLEVFGDLFGSPSLQANRILSRLI